MPVVHISDEKICNLEPRCWITDGRKHISALIFSYISVTLRQYRELEDRSVRIFRLNVGCIVATLQLHFTVHQFYCKVTEHFYNTSVTHA